MFNATLPSDRFFPERADGENVATTDDFSDLSDRSRIACALHHADRIQPGATGHKDCQRYGLVSKCARRTPVSVDRHQRADTGHTELRWAAPKSKGRRHLSILLRWTFPAEPVDREFQHPGWSEAVSVRFLLSELRPQRRFRRLELSIESVRFERGLRASFLCYPGPPVSGRHNRTAAWVSPESFHDFQFRLAIQRHRGPGLERRFAVQRPSRIQHGQSSRHVPVSDLEMLLHVSHDAGAVVHADSHQLSDRPVQLHAEPAAGEDVWLWTRPWRKSRSAGGRRPAQRSSSGWWWSAWRRPGRRLWRTRARWLWWARNHSALQPDVQRKCAERPEQSECGDAHRGRELTRFWKVDCSGGWAVLEHGGESKNRIAGDVQLLAANS